MVNYQKWFVVGAFAGVLNVVLLWLVGLIPAVSNILTPYVTGINTTLSNYVVALLSGLITLPGILVSAIGGGLFVVLGVFIYNLKQTPTKAPILKGPLEKLTLILVYAALGASLVLVGLKLPAVPTLITLVINAIITAWFILEVLIKRLNIIKLP